MTQNYDVLEGASGKARRFRPNRIAAHDLASSAIGCNIDNEPLALVDISTTGFSIQCFPGQTADLTIGRQVSAELRFQDSKLYEGPASVCWVDQGQQRAGLQLLRGIIDLDIATARSDALAAGQSVSDAFDQHAGLTVKERTFLSDMQAFCISLRSEADHLDQSSMEQTRTLLECVKPVFRDLWLRGCQLTDARIASSEDLAAWKFSTERMLTPLVSAGAIWDRSYSKPLGYPGDFMIMQQVYDGSLVGDTVYARVMHGLGLDVADCIRTRMLRVIEELSSVADSSTDRTARVMSIGSGPAEEVLQFAKSHPEKKLEATLLDQDGQALTSAFKRIGATGSPIRLHGLNVSFLSVIRWDGLVDDLPPQDLIYSVGLIDYLTARTTARLVRQAYKKLAPGGRLLFGNMAKVPLSNLWPMEMITDWTVIYRTMDEMRFLASELDPPPQHLVVEPDSTGRVFMLYVIKPE